MRSGGEVGEHKSAIVIWLRPMLISVGSRIDEVFGVLRRLLPIPLTGLLLASCSISPFAKSSSATLPLLCRSIPGLSKLTIIRTDGLPPNNMTFTFPATVKVSNQTQVQNVAKALCELPINRSHTSINCPAAFGVAYHLTFSSKEETFPVVSFDPSGCQFVHGLTRGRWVMQSPEFWHTLGLAMGIKGANNSTFRGQGPNAS